jgi:hypothetical protein
VGYLSKWRERLTSYTTTKCWKLNSGMENRAKQLIRGNEEEKILQLLFNEDLLEMIE